MLTATNFQDLSMVAIGLHGLLILGPYNETFKSYFLSPFLQFGKLKARDIKQYLMPNKW